VYRVMGQASQLAHNLWRNFLLIFMSSASTMVTTGLPHVLSTLRPSHAALVVAIVLIHAIAPRHVAAFSSEPSAAGFDRFRAECPASPASIALFDPSLVENDSLSDSDDEDTCTFVAVYRSANNLPSVIMRDELFASMRIATTASDATGSVGIETSESSISSASISGTSSSDDAAGNKASGVEAPIPLAVGRLRPSPPDSKFAGSYVLDYLRCSLKKEDTDPNCDGGSEHTEALGVCIDELVLHRLRLATESTSSKKDKVGASFDGALRAKATLVSGPLLIERGFQEIDEFPLPSDMATHVSSLDGCMERYASWAVDTSEKVSVGARERALKVLSLLGQLNREEEKKAKKKEDADGDVDGDGDDGYDPWANFVSVQGR